MSNVNNDFPQLPIYPDETFRHSDQEGRSTQQNLFGLPVKVTHDVERRCISAESDVDFNTESIVKKVLGVVPDAECNAGNLGNLRASDF